MPQPLKVLLAEDNPADAELVLRELRRAGFEPDWHRVDTEAEYLERLHPDLDIILSDYEMPQFSGFRALELLKQRGLEVPFIIVSGTIGEDTAVAAMKLGAADYLLKDRLARLGAVVTHAMAESRLHRERRQADEALRIAHAQLGQLLEHSPAVLYVLKLDGDKIVPHFVSENIITLLGFTAAETVSREWWPGQVHPDDRERALNSRTETLQAGTSRLEYRLRHKDGHYCWVDDSRRLIRDAAGAPVELSGVWTDITERKRAEEIIGQASGHVARNRRKQAGIELAILVTATAVIYVLAARFNWFEAATRWVLTYDAQQLDETILAILFLMAGLAVFAFRRWRESESELTSRQQAQAGMGLLHEELDRRVKQRTEELGNANQALRAEIAERERAEEALHVSEAQLRSFVEQTPSDIAMFDQNMIYLAVSRRWTSHYGRGHDNLVGLCHYEVHPDMPERWKEIHRKGLAGEVQSNDDDLWVHADGSKHWLRWVVQPWLDAGGKIGGVLIQTEDITEQKQLEEQFLHAQRMEAIGTLAAGVAHDLNNILAPMLMVAGILKLRTNTSAKDLEMLSIIENSGQRGAGIIRQLLGFSRGLSGERVALQIKHLVQEMAKIMSETFPRNITIVESVPADLWFVEADPTQLHQVIMNLCVNARDAMPAGGTLTLIASNVTVKETGAAPVDPTLKPGSYVLLEVRDTGTGIPPEIITRIFEPFFTTKEVDKGTGLGLSTVVGIIKSHGGVLKVDSEPGRGTTFRVYLPASVAHTGVPDKVTTAPFSEGHDELILVVDDEEPIRTTTRNLLEKKGYRVLEADSGEEAIKVFIQHQKTLRLVLTDIMMTGMDGLALIRVFRILEPAMPVIIASGLDQNLDLGEFNTTGVTEKLTKPFTLPELLKVIHKCLGQKNAK